MLENTECGILKSDLLFFVRWNMAAVIQETCTRKTSGSTSDVSERLSYLPENLKDKLLSFQKKGIVFALERGGR